LEKQLGWNGRRAENLPHEQQANGLSQ